MNTFSELELELGRLAPDQYTLALRFRVPGSDAYSHFPARPVGLDFLALRDQVWEAEAYGRALASQLFADPDAKTFFAQAQASAQTAGQPLRLRLFIHPEASELHTLQWEALRNPLNGSLLTTSENTWFSRYLSSQDWRAVRLLPKSELSAAALAANPSNLPAHHLSPVDVAGELRRAQQTLGPLLKFTLPEAATSRRATFDNLLALARQGCDVLYLACHGTLAGDSPILWLENDNGQVERVSGRDLVERLGELTRLPRLVILASCESAQVSEAGALVSLGPLLAGAGVPAVLAMQGKVTMETVAQFMPAFFRELQQDGQIDRAVAVARGVVRKRPDAWMPVLFLRSESGKLWEESSTPPADSFTSLPDYDRQRCQDLADQIKETLALLKDYEDDRRLASDPKTRRRAEAEIAALKTDLARYQQEYRDLGCHKNDDDGEKHGDGGNHDLVEESIRLDVAVPEKAGVNSAFDLAVAIRQKNDMRQMVDDLPKIYSEEGKIYYESTDNILTYRIEIEGNECEIKPSHLYIQLRPKQGSRIYYFQITPFRTGTLKLLVNAYKEDKILAAQTRIQVEVYIPIG